MAVRLPSGNSMVYLIVGRRVILNALASQHIALNLSRIVGSVVAGISIDRLGVEYTYLFMALSAWLGGLMVVMVRGDYRSLAPNMEPFWRSAVEGLRYAWSSAPIRSLLLMSVLMECSDFPSLSCCRSWRETCWEWARSGLGYLSAANAVGATVSTIIVASLGDFRNKQALLIFTALGAGLSVLLFALSPWFAVSLALSALVGATLMSYDAAMGTMLQLLTTDAVRGRVLGLLWTHLWVHPSGRVHTGDNCQPLLCAAGGGNGGYSHSGLRDRHAAIPEPENKRGSWSERVAGMVVNKRTGPSIHPGQCRLISLYLGLCASGIHDRRGHPT